MESRIIHIPKCGLNDHYLVASLILTEYYFHYTFTECYERYKNYLRKVNREFHINFLEFIMINREVSNVNQYPNTTDGTGLFETVYQYKHDSVQMNLTYREIWKFDNKPMMSSHDMPGKITISNETILYINLIIKNLEFVIVLNKIDHSMKISVPLSFKPGEKELLELIGTT